jgi:hypothetical protein
VSDYSAAAMLDALLRRIRAKDPDDRADAAREGAEEMHKALPESLSARKAIEEDRRRKAEMDRMLREASR